MTKTLSLMLLILPCFASAECILHLALNDGAVNDQSTFANSVQLHGGEWVDVGRQKMLELNGPGNGIAVKPDQLSASELTIAFWIKPTQTDVSKVKVFTGPNTSGRKGFFLIGKNAGGALKLTFALTTDSSDPSYHSVSIPYGRFSHIAIRADGKTLSMYINGMLEYSKEVVGKIIYNEKEKLMHIGSPYSKHFYGTLYDFRMFNQALGESEVLGLFEGAPIHLKKDDSAVRPAKKPPAGFKSDKLVLPHYGTCGNYIQNPSFEQGARYWTGIAVEYSTAPAEKTFAIDEGVGRSGTSSLVLYAWPGMSQQSIMVKSFAVPVTAQAVYTLSFYAKSDPGGVLYVNGESASKDTLCFAENREIGSEWERYSMTFAAPNGLFSPRFYTMGNETNSYRIWVDDVQLEAGGSVSAFSQNPVSVVLQTAKNDNLFNQDEAVDAKLVVESMTAGRAELSVAVNDVAGNRILSRSHFAELVPGENIVIPAPYLELEDSGLYSVVVDVTLSSGVSTTERFRVGRMNFLNNTHRHSAMFGVDRIFALPDHRHAIERMRNLGLGAKKIRDLLMSTDVLQMYRGNGIHLQPYLTYRAKVPYDLDGENGIKRPAYNSKLRHEAAVIRTSTNDVATVAESVYRIAKMYPEYDNWTLTGEPETHGGIPKNANRMEAIENFMALHRVLSDAVRRGNPSATICSPPPHNIDRNICMPLVEDYLKNGLGDFCDVLKGHAYRDTPESPDFDEDLGILSRLLDEYNFAGDIWLDEDMNYGMHVIPEMGADVTGVQNSAFWGQNWLSYDLGLGEKMNAAFIMRQWLIALKNQQRVKSLFWHNYRDSIMDLDAIPRLACWAPNTLGNLLGDGSFAAEVKLSDDTRCYVFKDGQNRPVAALWSCNPEIDREKKKPYVLHSAVKGACTLIDFCGKESVLREGQEVWVSGLPVFLRSEDADVSALVEALEESVLDGGSKTMLSFELNLLSRNAVEWVVENKTGRELVGELNLLVQGKRQVSAVTIGSGAVKKVVVEIAAPEAFAQVESIGEFTHSATGQKQRKDLSFVYIPSFSTDTSITVDGDLSDWDRRHALELPDVHCDYPVMQGRPEDAAWGGKQDLSARMYTAWDDTCFFLAVDVQDDVYAPAVGAKGFWEQDSLQLYFDSLGDARTHGRQGYDSNDYNYNVYRNGNAYEVFRDVMPDFQIAFLKKEAAGDVRRAFRKTDTGYVLELAIPFKDLNPIRFSSGSSFGFSLLINENDNDFRKRSLTLTPAGTTSFKKPHLWPLMHLID